MRLADDTFAINLPHQGQVTLRPSLRAAIRLEREFGFDRLARGIREGNLGVLSAIIRETATTDLPETIDISEGPLGLTIGAVSAACLGVLFGLAGIDPDAKQEDEPRKPSRPHRQKTDAEHLAQLYNIGTGWLGWTPETTLNATPTEITAAHAGRVELLGVMFGSSTEEEPNAPDFERDEAGFAAFKSKYSRATAP